MATRNERVVLTLDDNYTSGMARAAAATALLNHELGNLNDNHIAVQRNSGLSSEAVRGLNTETRRSTSSINQYSGRLGLLATALVALGPAAIPIGAVVVPAIAGLASELGFAAIAGGTAILAFHGFSDALKAMNKAAIAPTAENIAKAQQAMDKLSPSGQNLVVKLRSMSDEFRALRDAASEGLFPGISESLDLLETRLPQVEKIISHVSKTTGDILAEGAASLASNKWDPFFHFIDTQARPALADLAAAVGNVTHGLAGLFISTTPLAHGFSKWLVDTTKDFDRWANGLGKTQGFTDFLTYLDQTGPQVAETIGALATAFLDVIEAAAPLGGPVLHILEVLAKAISVIADSDLGTPIFIGLAALTLYTRATKLWGDVAASSAGQAIAGQVGVSGALRTNIALMSRLSLTTRQQTIESRAAGAAVRGTLLKSAGVMAGLAVVSSGAADNIGLSNTAMLALAGSMAGPPGAAIGAGVGLVLDLGHANDDLAEAIDRANKAMVEGAGPKVLAQQMSDLTAQTQAFADKVDPEKRGGFLDFITAGATAIPAQLAGVNEMFTHTQDKAQATKDDLASVQAAYADLAVALGAPAPSGGFLGQMLSGQGFPGLTQMGPDIDAIQRAAERAAPAMAALGISAQDLADMSPDQLERTADAIKAWNRNADSVSGRTHAVGKAFAGLDSDLQSTADSAKDLSTALDDLLSPQLNLSAATDAYAQALNDLDGDLAKHNRTLMIGNTDAALQNRDTIRGRVEDITALLKAQAEAGGTSTELTHSLAKQRNALIAAGVAAGLSKTQLKAYLSQIGLTPKLVKTVFEAAHVDKAVKDVKSLRKSYDGMPKKLRTVIEANGVPHTMATIKDLKKQYDLTPTEVQTLITLKDEGAFLDIADINKLLGKLHHLRVIPVVDPDTKKAHDEIEWIDKSLSALAGRHITTTVTTVHRDVSSSGFGPQANAMGGLYQNDVRQFGRGGFMDRANNHPPHIAPGGAYRIFAEKETKGEAYIPLANDHRRPRAVQIWEETGRRMGLQFARYAGGFVTPPNVGFRVSPVASSRAGMAPSIDYDRLTAAVLAARPPQQLYGNVHMQPHNYSEFQRQMREDMALNQQDGVRRQ
jgi:hypothetical protein